MTARVAQGTLNRILTALIVSGNSGLNVTAPYMGEQQARIDIPGPYDEIIGTATDVVTSPAPYTIATVSVSILRTQALANSWMMQAQANANIGDIVVYPDSNAWEPITVHNAVINAIDPHAYDGKDPVVDVILRGSVYLNNDMWGVSAGPAS